MKIGINKNNIIKEEKNILQFKDKDGVFVLFFRYEDNVKEIYAIKKIENAEGHFNRVLVSG